MWTSRARLGSLGRALGGCGRADCVAPVAEHVHAVAVAVRPLVTDVADLEPNLLGKIGVITGGSGSVIMESSGSKALAAA